MTYDIQAINALAVIKAASSTVDTGVLTLSQTNTIVTAEAPTTDDVNTIAVVWPSLIRVDEDFEVVFWVRAATGHTITLKHGVDNIDLPDDADLDITDDGYTAIYYDGTTARTARSVSTSGSGAVAASDVSMLEIGTATYDDVKDWADTTQSGGVISGGAITTNGDGTCAVASGTGIIKSTDSDVGSNLFFDFSADASVTLTDNSENWVYIDYNAGTPIIDATVNLNGLDLHTQIVIGKIWRDGTVLHIIQTGQYIADFSRKICLSLYEEKGFHRVSGAVISETGTRNFASTAGVFYCASNRITTSGQDTSVADTFIYYYSDGGGGFTEIAAQTQINNTQYDDGSGTLATLGNNRYGVHWIYVGHDGDLYAQFGTESYTLAEANAAQPPTPPPILTSIATLAAQIIIAKSAASFTSVNSAYESDFIGTPTTDHGDLSGLTDDDHPQYALLAGRATGQTLIGGTASGDDLTLETTSNATKGDYIFSEMTTAGALLNDVAGVVTGGNTVPIANGGTGQTAQTAAFDALSPVTTAGDVIYRDGSNNIRLAIGTATQVLTVNAGATAPEWAAAGGGSAAFNFRNGLKHRKLSASTILVGAGAITVESTLVEKTASTVLNLATAGHWIGGSSNEAASIYIHVYIDASGNLLLHDKCPHYPVAATASRVADAQVNQAGWDGTAAQGLNATSVVYDNDTGEGDIEAGMYALIYDDAAFTQGRGKGSAASASVTYSSVALITAVDTGTNTITLEAGHQIAINDDDYIIVIEAGALLYRQESATWYRWLGALFNDGSQDLTTNNETRSSYVLDEGADLTTTSTSFADVDSNFNLMILSNGNDILADFSGAIRATGTTGSYLDLEVDGTAIAGDDGIVAQLVGTTIVNSLVVAYTLADLLPGTHEVKLRWKSNGNTATMYAGAGTASYDLHPQFTIREVG